MSSPPSLTVTAHLTLLTLLAATTTYFFYKSRRLRLLKLHSQNPNNNQINTANLYPPRRGKLFYISQTGTSKTLAQRLFNLLTVNNIPFDLIDPKDYEPEDLHKETLVLIVASTWDDGNAPPSGGFFANWLAESAEDFRVGSLLLRECKFAVFGVGSKSYGETFNAVAREFSKRMRALGGAEVLTVCEGDVDGGQLNEVFDVWSRNVVGVLKGGLEGNGGYFGNVSDSEIVDELDEYDDDDDEEEENGEESEIVDLEDITGRGPSRKFEVVKKVNGKLNDEKEMVTPVIRASLVKQVIVSARKPEFFQMSHPLYEVVTEEGLIRPCFKARPGAVYSGGSAQMIEKSLNIHGDEILYVGDHIYTDVSQSKFHLRWRTTLICRELEEEVSLF